MRSYLSRARERLAAAGRREPAEKLAKAMRRLRDAVRQAARRRPARRGPPDPRFHRQAAGPGRPEKLEVYDFSSYTDKQLAEEISRELPELIREAERLTRRAPAPHEDEKPDADDPLGPPHPDA